MQRDAIPEAAAVRRRKFAPPFDVQVIRAQAFPSSALFLILATALLLGCGAQPGVATAPQGDPQASGLLDE